jgi:hypothetical protein
LCWCICKETSKIVQLKYMNNEPFESEDHSKVDMIVAFCLSTM